MKAKILLTVFAALGVVRYATAAVPAPSDFLYAIRLVETGDSYDAPRGRAGELGPYQFRFAVWRQHTTAPFWRARTAFADTVAVRHYCWIARELESNGVAATPWNIAAAWNCGVDAVVSGCIPPSSRDYATRVVNLVEKENDLRRSLTPRFQIAFAGSR